MGSLLLLLLGLASFELTLANEAVKGYVHSNNLFTPRAYKIISRQESNFVFSPFTIETMFTMLLLGAIDETANEIQKSLLLSQDNEKNLMGAKYLFEELTDNAVSIANKLYTKRKLKMKDTFKNPAKNFFNTTFARITNNDRDKIVNRTTNWVKERTNSRIDFSTYDIFGSNFQIYLILLNALYLKTDWYFGYNVNSTDLGAFLQPNAALSEACLMKQYRAQEYYKDNKLKATFVRMQLGNEKGMTMTIVLPNELHGIFTLEENIEKVFKTPKYKKRNIILTIPKVSFSTQVDVKQVLEQLGVHKLFDPEEAELVEVVDGKDDFYVEKITQNNYININETGIELASAIISNLFMSEEYVPVGHYPGGGFPASAPVYTKVNYPFIFYVNVGDLILFAGRVQKPTVICD